MSPVKSKLENMINREIIAEVKGSADFVSNLVVVEKVNKKIRLCLDPQTLKLAIKEENHIIPTFEELAGKLKVIKKSFLYLI